MFWKKYIAGVSGGPDSMALLNMFKKKIVAVCHVNYCKRSSSMRDEKIVENFCKKNQIIFFCLRVSKNNYECGKSNNFQHQARQIRYDFYEKCAQKVRCWNVLTGHNLDDSLETAYDQINRRVITTFYGIRKKNFYRSIKIYRPLIYIRKKALERYCQSLGIEFGVDETNFSDIYKRNLNRKIIAKWSPEKFLLFCSEIRKKNCELKKINRNIMKNYRQWKKSKHDLQFLLNLSINIRHFILYRWLRDNAIECRSRKKIYLIETFINKMNQQKKLRLQQKIFLQINNNQLSLLTM